MDRNYERIAMKLQAVEGRYEELGVQLTLPEVTADSARLQQLMREHSELGELAEFDRATTEATDLVGALVAAMTPPDRDIFLRKYYLLQSGKEIAAALGMSVESVNTRLSRGRDRLRPQLTEKGVYSHA